jgi:hypothetical protein
MRRYASASNGQRLATEPKESFGLGAVRAGEEPVREAQL